MCTINYFGSAVKIVNEAARCFLWSWQQNERGDFNDLCTFNPYKVEARASRKFSGDTGMIAQTDVIWI